MTDPFQEFRQSTALYSATTAPDGKTLTLIAVDDHARFHHVAHAAIETANRHGWRVKRLHRVGHNVSELVIAPSR